MMLMTKEQKQEVLDKMIKGETMFFDRLSYHRFVAFIKELGYKESNLKKESHLTMRTFEYSFQK